jgi:pyruvate/2-oxoglutarate dehydrogenase complex dihydrolipoamide acyltransferase (E2) component
MTTEERKAPTVAGAVVGGKKVKEVIPVRGIRRTMAEHMQRSLLESAQLSSTSGVDMTEMIKCRETMNKQGEAEGVHYTWTDLFVKIAAEALKLNPIVNSSLIDKEILIWDDINIGVALDFEMRDGRRGLIVPVVRNADRKSVKEIHNALEEFKEKGKAGKLMPDDTTGGTFTVTNTGALGGGRGAPPGIATGMASTGTPIINQPQAAIWGMGGYNPTPVVVDGQVVVRPVMYYNMTCDHRILTGADMGSFGGTIHRLLLTPARLFLQPPAGPQ